MISREELIEVLNEYDFTEEQINRIAKSKIRASIYVHLFKKSWNTRK